VVVETVVGLVVVVEIVVVVVVEIVVGEETDITSDKVFTQNVETFLTKVVLCDRQRETSIQNE
jgi:hypothetical protein